MALTTKILRDVTSIGASVYSTDAGQYGTVSPHPNFVNGVLRAQRIKDKAGIFQVKAGAAGLTGDVTLQGRMSPTDAWYNIVSINQAEWNAQPNLTYIKLVTLFPEMRAAALISAGAPNISAWVTE